MANHPWTAVDPSTGRFARRLSDEERDESRRAAYRRYRKKLTAARHLQANHGMPLAEGEALLAARPEACEICGEARKLYYDHDHASGAHRGWLCNHCNTSLSLIENPALLESALRYLGRNS